MVCENHLTFVWLTLGYRFNLKSIFKKNPAGEIIFVKHRITNGTSGKNFHLYSYYQCRISPADLKVRATTRRYFLRESEAGTSSRG